MLRLLRRIFWNYQNLYVFKPHTWSVGHLNIGDKPTRIQNQGTRVTVLRFLCVTDPSHQIKAAKVLNTFSKEIYTQKKAKILLPSFAFLVYPCNAEKENAAWCLTGFLKK